MNVSVSLIICYAIFSLFGFYQKLHIKNFAGASQVFLLLLNLFTLAATIFGIGFLLYFGYTVSWIQALVLLCVALAVKFVWFPIEIKLGFNKVYPIFSIIGFIVMPICGYFMLSALP